MNTRTSVWHGVVAGLACALLAGATWAAPAQPQANKGKSALRAEIQDVDAQLAAAKARHMSLQSQVTDLEGQNADRKRKLAQRDEQIAALRKQLQAAGVPASATSTVGH